jgi:tetratricopeptide (TPR) repeat protein
MLGRVLEKQQKPGDATQAYRLAAAKFGEAGQPEKQSHVFHAMAVLAEKQGRWADAQTAYEAVIQLDQRLGNTRGLARAFNDLGNAHLQQGNGAKAIETFKQAYREASRAEGDARLIPDIFSNLGGAYRAEKQYRQAYNAYKVSLDRAIRVKDAPGAIATLENLAALSLEAQKPEKAMQFLQRADALRTKFSPGKIG